MLPPVDVTPPLSNAFRYSSATDLRCSSVMVWVLTAMHPLLSRAHHHVFVDPRREPVTIAGDGLPFLVEVVVTRRIADGEARMGAVRHGAHGVDDPRWQDDGVRTGLELVDDLFHRDDRPMGCEHGFLLHSYEAPQ